MKYALFLAIFISNALLAQELKTEHFDADPKWDSQNNHVVPDRRKTVVQDFGYSNNEIGGTITRASKPAFYAKTISATLNDPLSASGTFSITKTSGNSGIFLGFFNSNQPGSSGRPIQSLGMDFDGEPSGGRLAVRMIAADNHSCGTFITPFIPGKFRPTPIRNDGTTYTWSLNYDPKIGNGQFTYTIKSDRDTHEAFEGKKFVVDVPAEVRKSGATFTNFGLMNAMKAGSSVVFHLKQISINGQAEDLSKEPGWESSGNRAKYEDQEPVGAHNFGYSATNFAGGASAGEIGGLIWRGGKFAYYADRVGPLTLQNKVEAKGKMNLKTGAPDSDAYIGFFNSSSKSDSPTHAGNFLGIHIGGPTRVGHMFSPVLLTAHAKELRTKTAPVIVQNRAYDWSFTYDPAAANGNGEIHITLGDKSLTLPLPKGMKEEGASFDRFGIFNPVVGGQAVKLYFDDLTYTAH